MDGVGVQKVNPTNRLAFSRKDLLSRQPSCPCLHVLRRHRFLRQSGDFHVRFPDVHADGECVDEGLDQQNLRNVSKFVLGLRANRLCSSLKTPR